MRLMILCFLVLSAGAGEKLKFKLQNPVTKEEKEFFYKKIAPECRKHYKAICAAFGEKVKERTVKIVFKKMKAPAAVAGQTIFINFEYATKHPKDLGCYVHELAHIVQDYRGAKPWWMVEGLADYVRFAVCYKNLRALGINNRSHYTNGYRATGRFLHWLVDKKDKKAVLKIHGLLKKKKFTKESMKDLFGKDIDSLWAEFTADILKK